MSEDEEMRACRVTLPDDLRTISSLAADVRGVLIYQTRNAAEEVAVADLQRHALKEAKP